MRADLALMATVDGEPLEFVARDVPVGVFFCQFQDTFPGADCFASLSLREQWANIIGFQDWTDALLARAIVEPSATLTAGNIRGLGTARDELAQGYLWGIGYYPPSQKDRERLVPPRPIAPPVLRQLYLPDDWATLRLVPPPNIRHLVREVASRARVAAWVIWESWTISEFVMQWRLGSQDDMKKRAAKSGGPLQSEIMDVVGREGS